MWAVFSWKAGQAGGGTHDLRAVCWDSEEARRLADELNAANTVVQCVDLGALARLFTQEMSARKLRGLGKHEARHPITIKRVLAQLDKSGEEEAGDVIVSLCHLVDTLQVWLQNAREEARALRHAQSQEARD
jgi:hypothetical protein